MSYLKNEEIIREQILVYLKKNKDYGDSYTEQLDKYGIVAFKVVAGFKVSRILQFALNGDLENESAKDSALDLLNYVTMTQMWEGGDLSIINFIDIMVESLEDEDYFESDVVDYIAGHLDLEDRETDYIRSVYFEMLDFDAKLEFVEGEIY